MSAHELKDLLDQVADTRELVLRRADACKPDRGALHDAWHDAHEEAVAAYRRWQREGGGRLYAAYRAAQDREDAAQDALTDA
jgi:hypothetical protein